LKPKTQQAKKLETYKRHKNKANARAGCTDRGANKGFDLAGSGVIKQEF